MVLEMTSGGKSLSKADTSFKHHSVDVVLR